MLLTTIGATGGIAYAAWVRRNKRASRYAAKIRVTPYIWPDEYLEEIEGRKIRKDPNESQTTSHSLGSYVQ